MIDRELFPDPLSLDPFPYESVAGVTCEVLRPPGEVRGNVVALHGILSDSRSYRGFMRPFTSRGWAVYAVNYPHHGPDYCSRNIRGLRANDCLEAARAVVREVGDAIVIGKSFGGLMAQALAHEPDVRATVLLASSPPPGIRYTPKWREALPFLVRLGPRTLMQLLTQRTFLFSYEFCRRYIYNAAESDEQARAWHGSNPESVWLVWDQVRYRIPVFPERREAPMLVTVGSDDPGLPVNLQLQTANLWGAEFHEFPGHSHMLTLEPGWERICLQLLQWLDTRVPAVPAKPVAVKTPSSSPDSLASGGEELRVVG